MPSDSYTFHMTLLFRFRNISLWFGDILMCFDWFKKPPYSEFYSAMYVVEGLEPLLLSSAVKIVQRGLVNSGQCLLFFCPFRSTSVSTERNERTVMSLRLAAG